MCTVSFVYNNGKFIITSNRDEIISRQKTLEPRNYLINRKNVLYPKDLKSGGTWFVIDEKGHVVVLLNGAQEKHIKKLNYRKSRGLIVLDLISFESILAGWNNSSFEDIEPFTLIVFEYNKLYQLRWDGFHKENLELSITKTHIWSSCTLYSEEVQQQRVHWFANCFESKNLITELDVMNFHRNTEKNDQENGLIIDRKNQFKTVSITQTVIDINKVVLNYNDLLKRQLFRNSFIII